MKNRLTRCMLWSHWGDSAGAKYEFGPAVDPEAALENPDEYLALRDAGAWRAGEPTDDTDMAMAILYAYTEQAELNSNADAAGLVPNTCARFVEWGATRPKDIGILTRQSLSLIPSLGGNAGKHAWARSGRKSAGNGGLMRCHPTGVIETHRDDMLGNAAKLCQITHYDPRCVYSCLFQNCLIWLIARHDMAPAEAVGGALKVLTAYSPQDFGEYTDEESMIAADGLHEACDVGVRAANAIANGSVEFLPSSGYTYHGVSHAVFAAMSHGKLTPQQIIAFSIAHGDDADTNGAIVGAVVGASAEGEPECADELLGSPFIRYHAERCFVM